MATSPRKSPTPKRSLGSTKPKKSARFPTRGKGNGEGADESSQETEEQTGAKKSISRKPTGVADPGEKEAPGMAPTTTFWICVSTHPPPIHSQTKLEESFKGVCEHGQGKCHRRWAGYQMLGLNTV